jgi:hypothetical protein
MQQLVYDIIERSIPNVPNNNNENNSVHSDITITPPISTKNGSNNSCKESQKDIQYIRKKIFFIDYNNNNKINIKNNKKEKKFLEKKRKRFFLIKKIQKKKVETAAKTLPKINKIIFNNFKLEKVEEKKNLDNNTKIPSKNHNYFINVLVNKDKNFFNNNNIINIKQDENLNNNIKIFKNDNIKNSNKIFINKEIKENKEKNNTSPKEENKLKETDTNNINNKKPNEFRRKKKKSNYTTEKELQIAYEKKFLENINKNYSDKEYEEDIKQCLKDKKKKFMKENFPIMFQKDKFYLYSILPKKRLASKEYYIEPEFFDKNKIINNFDTYVTNNELISNEQKKDVNYSNNNKNKIFKISKIKKNNKNDNLLNLANEEIDDEIKERFDLEPKKVWSLKKDIKINIDDFFEDCTQIWPFDECCFVKEIALEFLMKNNYSIKYCFDNIKEFIFFMKKRAKELDFPLISESVKTIKRYHLRKTNFN